MMRTRWLYFLPLMLIVAAPMQGEGRRARNTRPHLAATQAAQQASPSVPAEPSIESSETTPSGFIPPGGTPPTVTPDGDEPEEHTVQPLGDAHRDYRGQLAVFPGAEGFGTTTPAGRGGQILKVTTLADSGVGSFREAVTATGPRTVVFEVGGIIQLKSKIVVTEPFLTIAGQTAPSPGITLSGDMLRFETHDVLIQHLRIRPGDGLSDTNTPPEFRDGLSIATNSSGFPHAYNIVIDHCSISWGIDETVSLWYPNVYDITISNSIVSESLRDSLHPDGYHAMGLIVGHGQRRIAIVRNLFAHNQDRNPMFTGDSTGLVVNNVIYNVVYRAMDVGFGSGPGPILLTATGNVYLPGEDSNESVRMITVRNTDSATRLFVVDNTGPHSTNNPWSVVDNRAGRHVKASAPPVTVAPLTVLASEHAYPYVLRNAGARPVDRDTIDRRVVEDVRLSTGHLIDSPSDVGGLPREGTRHHVLQLPASPTADGDGDGYTDVEEWLHCLAARVESPSRSLKSASQCSELLDP